MFLIPLLAASLPAQTNGPEINIQSLGDTNAALSWEDPTREYIVVRADTLAGPWVPCLNPVAYGPVTCTMTVPCTNNCKYFRLARGYWEDFEDGDLNGWTVAFIDPQATNYVNWECTNGQLRVYGHWPGNDLDRRMIFYRTNLTLADFIMSIDILGWEDGVPGDQPIVSLFGRLDPATLNFPAVYSCGGAVGLRYDVDPNLSALSLWKSWPGGVAWSTIPIAKTDPAKDYGLLFDGVGGEFHVQVWEVPWGSGLVEHHYASDSTPLLEGWVGLHLNVKGTNGVFNFTFDNFVAHVRSP